MHTKSAWLHANKKIKGSEVGTVIQRERVVCFKAYHFILSCIFTSKPLSMQISLAWTVDSPITSYFFSFALTAPCCAWALAQWRCMGVYVCVSVCRGDFFFFLLVCKFGGRQIWVCMHEWMFGSVCMCVCVPCVCVGIWLPDTWLCLVLALCSAHQMFSFFIILHLHRVLWGFLRICAAHIQLALLFSAVLWVKTKCSSKPFYFLSLKEEGYYKQQLSKLHLDSKLCANNWDL